MAGYGGVGPSWSGASANLPFNSTPSAAPTSLAGLQANYGQEYEKSVNFNKSNYENIISGFHNSIAQSSAAAAAVDAGYNNLYDTSMSTIRGMFAGRNTEIQDSAKQTGASMMQGLIDSGLGNTTVQASMKRGVEGDMHKRLTESANQEAGTTAGYQNQIRQAQLSAQERSNQALMGLQGNQLGMMERVNALYPNAGMYGQLAQQLGTSEQQKSNAGRMGVGGIGGASGGGGYTPVPLRSYAPWYSGGGNVPQAYGGGGSFGSWAGSPISGGGSGWGGSGGSGGGFDWGGAGGAISVGAENTGRFDWGGAGGAISGGAYDAAVYESQVDPYSGGWSSGSGGGYGGDF